MSINLPNTLPPPSLWIELLPHLLNQLENKKPSTESFQILQITLHIYASLQLSSSSSNYNYKKSNIPLKKLLEFSTIKEFNLINSTILLNCIISYPLNLITINEILSNCFLNDENQNLVMTFKHDIIPNLLNRLSSLSLNDELNLLNLKKIINISLCLIRSHDELLIILSENSENLFKNLKSVYESINNDIQQHQQQQQQQNEKLEEDKIKIEIKSDILMICKELLDNSSLKGNELLEEEENIIKFMGNSSLSNNKELFQNGNSLKDDWEIIFKSNRDLNQIYKNILEKQRNENAKSDLRVKYLLKLFPTLQPYLLLSALSHPNFTSLPEGSRATPSEQASPIVEIILNGGEGLPNDLNDLKIAIQNLSQDIPIAQLDPKVQINGNEKLKINTKVERRNIFNDEDLDISKLRLKEDESTLPTLSNTIPDSLRASIMRLVENQVVEEEERKRALKDANLLDDDEDDYEEGDDGIISRIKVGGDTRGDDDDDDNLNEEDGVKISKESSGTITPSGPSDKQKLDILRTSYITNPKIFERDGITRRSNERKKLREIIGWDDGQIEGWKIMLERDPHKEDILAAHADRLSRLRDSSPTSHRQGNDISSRGGGNGRGGRGRGGGRGGSGGNRGNGKSSRGHSNVTRTRGHDKKMSKMGAL
ncbi:uncharacterized protein I206_101416 [Kwoniella pini CBS 10737]|uniref:CUE domain-containing protein n=1 Tax=Kwoniella pini CBS 10737 TaxID=1296096 RepID=A0A1B9HWU1_9TREE|nr:uncharacterized protein I206_06614 [Kwoniella pini CBS 10737]OCF47708.1 hypothetical protein I206_06614 [Kwoniella pini CBS 10737]